MSEENFRNGAHVVYKLHAHIIFVTKYRRKVMTERVSNLIKQEFEKSCEKFKVELDEFETDDDHVHILITYPPKVCLSSLVKSLKIRSSKVIRQQNWDEVTSALWGNHFWSNSYCVVSCGGAPFQIIKKYIQNQKMPNKKPGHQPKKGYT
jgi:putative transposase